MRAVTRRGFVGGVAVLPLIRFTAAFLDQGFADWQIPHRSDGFFKAFVETYRQPLGPLDGWLHDLPAELLAAVQPVVNPGYGKEITTMMREGVTRLSPDEFRGLIAFPSFHTIMALIATYHAREMRWLLYPLLAVNMLILPAVLVHGGHHLVDIPAGFAVFALAALLAGKMVGAAASDSPAATAENAAA